MGRYLFFLGFLLANILSFGQCPNLNINLTSQAAVDNFATMYPNCTILRRDLNIIGSSITNLNGLAQIEQVGGTLLISNNSSITSLQGMVNLKNVINLSINNNDQLPSLDFSRLLQVVSSLSISNNDLLNDIDGLRPFSSNSGMNVSISIINNINLSDCSISFVCDALINSTSVNINNNALGCNSRSEVESFCSYCPLDITLSTQAEVDAFITNYPGCTNIKGGLLISGIDIVDLTPLFSLETVGLLYIINNPVLTNLHGLENLVFLDPGPNSGSVQLNIINNNFLQDITALSSLKNTDPIDIIINDNPSILNLNGLNNLEGNSYSFFIENNDNLSNLEGLSGIEGADDFFISNNNSLVSLEGVDTLTIIGSLYIINNNQLISLDFPNLINPLCQINIENNDFLSDIDTFVPEYSRQCAVSISIQNNPNLSNCSVDYVCSILPESLNTLINNNLEGCNNEMEVEVNCGTISGVTNFVSGAWDNGVPNSTSYAFVKDDYDTESYGNIQTDRLSVQEGVNLIVSPNTFLEVQDDIKTAGNLIVEHQGSVVQVNSTATTQKINNGTINVNLTTPNLASRDFIIMGSPMTSETREGVWNSAFLVLNHLTGNFVPNAAVAAAFPLAENFADDNYDNWIAYNGAINLGEGYIVRPQTGYGQPGGVFNYTYDSGTLTNGIVNFNVLYNTPGTPSENKNASPNILANPYPSAIWANDFINANPMVDEVYFWEHNTPPSPSLPGAGSMNFSMEDISMYNLVGGTAAASGGTAPNGYISTGQGFAIKASAAGTAVFTNAMRRTDNNNTLRSTDESLERIWLKVETPQFEMQSSTLIAFSENCTPGIEKGYDSRRIATVVSLYSQLEDGTQELGIQSREQFNRGMKIPLGFSSLIEEKTTYEISIDNLEGGNLTRANILLVDLEEKVTVNLKDGAYAFESDSGTYTDRFYLVFQRSSFRVLKVGQAQLETISLFPNPTQGLLTITSPNTEIEKVRVYDLQGREVLVSSEKGMFITIDLSKISTSVYFVTVETSFDTITKKIVKQ